MRDGDIFRRALERRVFRRLDPFERELAVLDPLNGGEPEAVEFPLLVPKRGQNPCPDPQRLPGIGRTGEVGSIGRQKGERGWVLVLFCRRLQRRDDAASASEWPPNDRLRRAQAGARGGSKGTGSARIIAAVGSHFGGV